MKQSATQSSLPDDQSHSVISTANPTAPGQKNWFIPADRESYKTHIDHGWKTNEEGYPIYPNGKTTFVLEAGQKITNFGTVGFTKTVGMDYNKDQTWKTTCVYCLGVLCCDIETCQWFGLPPTAKQTLDKYLALSDFHWFCFGFNHFVLFLLANQ
jgi:hypothetical protein